MLQGVGVQTGCLVRLLKKGDDDDLGSSVVLSLSDDCGESLVGQKVQRGRGCVWNQLHWSDPE